jgi:hypothetical protein
MNTDNRFCTIPDDSSCNFKSLTSKLLATFRDFAFAPFSSTLRSSRETLSHQPIS